MSGLDVDAVVRRGGFVLDVALAVGKGECVAVVGPNGAGKSTALRAIAGLTPVERGHISLAGRVLDDGRAAVPVEDRRCALVFADRRLFPHLTARANVEFAARAAGATRVGARIGAEKWLDRFELLPLAARKPDQLSNGQSQRVALARALAQGADLLLLDEPTSALDAETRTATQRELKRHLSEADLATVLVTHDPREARELADRVVVLEAGRVVRTATHEELTQAPGTDYVRRFLAGHG